MHCRLSHYFGTDEMDFTRFRPDFCALLPVWLRWRLRRPRAGRSGKDDILPFSHTWTLVSHINDAGFLIPWRAPVRADMNLPPPQAFNVSKPNWRRRSSFPMRLMAGLDIADRRCSPVSLRFYVPGAQPYTAHLHPSTLGCSGAPFPSGGLYRTWITTCLKYTPVSS